MQLYKVRGDNMLDFYLGTQEEYDEIVVKDAEHIYVTTDTNRIYRGDKLIGSGVISYSDVTDKPTINSIKVDGAKTANDYNIGNGLNIDNSKVTYKNVEKLLSEVLSVITPINELNTESDSPVSTKAIMPMITPLKGDATGATYLDTNALPADTYRCYMPIDDEVRMKMGANKYRLRQGNILVVATSDTQHQLIVLSKTGFSLYVHTLSDNTVSTYRDPHLKPDDYDRYKSRYCYSDKKVDELIGCSGTEVQIGTWIDKKPLYKKAIQFVSDEGYTAATTTLSYPDIKLKNLVSANISIHRTDGTERWDISSSDNCKVSDFTATSCILHLGEGVTADAVNVVLEYTKTTDTTVATLELADDEDTDEDTVSPQLELEV